MRMIGVMVTKRPWLWEQAKQNFDRQERKLDALVVVAHDCEPQWLMFPGAIWVIAPKESILGDLQNAGMTEAAKLAYDEPAMLLTFDDDDWYGPKYVQQIENKFNEHPDAIVIGKHTAFVGTVGNFSNSIKFDRTNNSLHEGDRCREVIGATLSLNAAYWNKYPELRYPSRPCGADWYIQLIAHNIYRREHGRSELGLWVDNRMPWIDPDDWAPIYTTGEDEEYRTLRYSDPAHQHTWKW